MESVVINSNTSEKKKVVTKKNTGNTIIFLVLCALVVVFLYPIAFIVINSFKGKFFISDNPFALPSAETFVGMTNYVNGLVQQYDIPIYYMTIGPCNGHWEQKNSEVLAFNSALTQMLDPKVTVIDAYSYIKNGLDSGLFATMDGLHYDYYTSKAIYEFMVEQVTNP